MSALPRPLDPFVRLGQVLRGAGFAVSPDQTIGFIAAVGILGPRDMTDIFRAGRALYSVPPERMAEYDALFRAVFLGQTVQGPVEGEEDAVEAFEPTGTTQDRDAEQEQSEIGAEAVRVERLSQRTLREADDDALTRLRREAARALPRRVSHRWARAKAGDRLDMRRILREMARRDGDAVHLFRTQRRTRQRRVLLLIDVSGSMKDRTGGLLRLAHAVVQSADRAEVFTLGTRLTRITAALRPANTARALSRAGSAIADIDGGTRIGDALQAFLAVPRYAGFARGAAVTVLSDGLERGGPAAMTDAVTRLARLAWRVDWLSPLAADPGYAPRTAGLASVVPVLDTLGDGATTAAIADHLLTMARRP